MKKVLSLLVAMLLTLSLWSAQAISLPDEKALNPENTSRNNPAPIGSLVFAPVIEESGDLYVLQLRLESAETIGENLIIHFAVNFSKTRHEQDIELYLMPDDFALVTSWGVVVADIADGVLLADAPDEEFFGQMISAYPESTLRIKVAFRGCAEYAKLALLRYESAYLSVAYAYNPKVIALNRTWFAIK